MAVLSAINSRTQQLRALPHDEPAFARNHGRFDGVSHDGAQHVQSHRPI